MYLVTAIHVHTHNLFNGSISNTMDATWVTALIVEAMAKHGKPVILNRD
jgi:hypothetical protein